VSYLSMRRDGRKSRAGFQAEKKWESASHLGET